MPKKSKKEKTKGEKQALVLNPPRLESTPIKFWTKPNEEPDVVMNTSSSEDKNSLFMERMKEVFGVKDFDLACSIFRESTAAIEPISGGIESLNIIAQSLNDLGPKDAIEARLAAQAAVVFTHGMECLQKAGKAEMINHKDSYINTGCKLLRLHNETIETMNRYKRGGEQKVTVTHAILAGNATVNNFNGVGVPPENRGDTPCQQCAEPKPEPTKLDRALSQPWVTDDVDSMVDEVLAPKRRSEETE
jgi:hypothetical protein